MKSLSRRHFLKYSGTLAGGALFLPPIRIRPELILYNGNVITVDQSLPRAEAVAIAQGMFIAIGSNDEIRRLATTSTKSIDLGGKTVTPGFIDSHSHPASSGRSHLHYVDCDLRSIEEIKAAIRKRASETAPGQWVFGFKYDDTKTKEGRFLTKEDLDDAAPKHPVQIRHRGGHTMFVNSLAFERVKVNEKTEDPPGGHFDRDPSTGKLNGRILENAGDRFGVHRPKMSVEDYVDGVKLISKMLAKAGITSVHDAGGSPKDLNAFQAAYRSGDLKTRVVLPDPRVLAG